MSHFENIVIGAGHNGLVCAAMLARAGQSVLLLESSGAVGGLAACREFHPGFRVPVAHTASHFSGVIAKNLNLPEHGLMPVPAKRLVGLSPDGGHVVLEDGKLSGVSTGDTEAFAGYRNMLDRFAAALEPFWLKTIPRVAPGKFRDMLTFAHLGLNIRRMGKTDMREFLRVFALPMRDLMDEHFESDLLKAMLSWDGLLGSKTAPRSPNSAVLTLLYRMAPDSISCDVPNLVSALQSAAENQGVRIRTGAAVKRILVDGDGTGLRATGIRLMDGEEISAGRVISSADPRTTFFDLLGARHLEIGFSNRIRRLRCNGHVAKLHLALDRLPEFIGIDGPDGRMLIAPDPDAIEFAYDDAKYGRCSEQPVMEITVPSQVDASLAPAGGHVLSAHLMYAPYDLKGGWNEDARQALMETAVGLIENHAPGIRAAMVGAELLAPPDIERIHGVSGGHWHHAEMALDQMLMMRPTYEAAQYSTPLPGLFLCGAGCHPGGDLTGAAGHNAAQEILR